MTDAINKGNVMTTSRDFLTAQISDWYHGEIDDDDKMDDLGLDSLDLVEVEMAAEEEFGITVPHEHFKPGMTFGETLAAIDALIEGKS